MNINKKINILAVDDNQGNLTALEAVFFGTPYHLIEAHSGFEALAYLKSHHHDVVLVLLDVQMPEMDGFETALKIKQIPGCKDLPIIFITAVFHEDPFIRRGYESGAIDYFSKPFDPEILKMKVEMYSSFRQKSFLLKEREKRIQETEELVKVSQKFTQVFESMTVGVLIADKDGKIFQTNEVVSRIFNSSVAAENDFYGDILGWWDEHGIMLKNNHGPLWKAINLGVSTYNEMIQVKSLGHTNKNLLTSASPLLSLDGKNVMGAVVVVQDITESKKVEQAFQQQISQLITLGMEIEHGINQR
ncbi:MAG TPA: response regulator [Bacteriovoracaceae bacterium]|nr:response regulator [Bacteriovoracaceae bacterium]